MTPAQIAAQLEAEADGLEASTDPVARAAGKRLRMWATEVRRMPKNLDTPAQLTPLPFSERSVSMDSDMVILPNKSGSRRIHKSAATEAIDAKGWSLRQLATALTEKGHKVSHVHLGDILAGKKGSITPELKRLVKEITGAKI